MVVDPLLCSREELLVLLAGQTVVIEGLAAQVENLQALVVELRRRLDADSSNSSRPPSSDSPFKRPPPKESAMPPEDEGPARKQGKQRGAAGKNRRQVDNPDEEIGVEPLACTGCGVGLAGAELLRVYRRQVFEASPPPRVIQYDVAERRRGCCGQVNQGSSSCPKVGAEPARDTTSALPGLPVEDELSAVFLHRG